MKYKEYIELGFKRTDLNDNVEFNNTGYHGFTLEKKVNKKMLIAASSGELDEPHLYIKKRHSNTYHIIRITPEAVYDILNKETNYNYPLIA